MKRHIANILLVLLPLTALVASGVAVHDWYRALYPDIETSPVKVQAGITPAEFSAGIPGILESIVTETGLTQNQISTSTPDIDDQIQHVYTVRIPAESSTARYHLLLARRIEAHGGGVMRSMESAGGRTLSLTLGVGETPTDVVVFRKSDGVRSNIVKMAVIVDDLGIRSLDTAERLCAIGAPLTLSILPLQRHTGDVVQLARRTGTRYMLHMPMEPLSNAADPGEGAITAEDSGDAILRKLAIAWDSVPGALGMNNHMGSRATESTRVMTTVMEYLGDHKYFFVDSRTSNATVGFGLSRKLGIKGAVMDGYLDVEDDADYIARRLDELSDRARANGVAVVICHDRPTTVAVLEQKLPQLAAAGITFVPIDDIIR